MIDKRDGRLGLGRFIGGVFGTIAGAPAKPAGSSRAKRSLLLVALGLLLVACSATGQQSGSNVPQGEALPEVQLAQVVTGLQAPTTIEAAHDGSNRLFILEQVGRIRIVEDGQLLQQPFLDLSAQIASGGEQGLLGIAFHPQFAQNGRFYLNYTNSGGDTVVSSFTVSDQDPNRASSESEQVILTVQQPFRNHNGGGLAFGPEGYLYISLGDGGGAGDRQNSGQDPSTLLGSLLRIDVDSGDPYSIPEDNPFANSSSARDELWAYGLRNPWRFSFDPATGDLWIADVGQNMYEEVDFEAASSEGGRNYGWRLMEGAHCFRPSEGCEQSDLVMPLIEYSHDQGCSVTGGYVYRGDAIPALDGHYIFGDYCSGHIWAARSPSLGEREAHEQEAGAWPYDLLLESGLRISAFGQDESGEVYVADHQSGTIYRLEARR